MRIKSIRRTLLSGDRWIHAKLGYAIKPVPAKTSFYRTDYDHSLGFRFEKEANEYIKQVRNNTMLPYIRLVTLYQQVVHCEQSGVSGSFVECGVWKGGSVGLMALANLRNGTARRHIHLFDAFDDICEPDRVLDGDAVVKECGKSGRAADRR